jgi:hypothetical protein
LNSWESANTTRSNKPARRGREAKDEAEPRRGEPTAAAADLHERSALAKPGEGLGRRVAQDAANASFDVFPNVSQST